VDLGLKERVALVLAAGGGLGRAIAVSLAAEGAKVALVDIDGEALKASDQAVRAVGGTCVGLQWDISDTSLLETQFGEIEHKLGSVDILVNNTGGPPPALAVDAHVETWRRQFDAMVLSVIAVTSRALPAMRHKAWGRIITSTSSGVIAPIPSLVLSNALRLSLVGWSKTLSREVGRDGITANIVLPGRISTARTRLLDEVRSRREARPIGEIEAESCAAMSLGRYGDPREYADVVTFLASARASYITGSIIRVDGGLLQST
jgi:3-oxoacyl-[acyl-carrier protein] reductase